jgi:hypothetical protein
MAKGVNFEDILTRDFRWPMNGDKLFEPSSEWMGDAMLANDRLTRLVLMTSGYKKAAQAYSTTSMSFLDTRASAQPFRSAGLLPIRGVWRLRHAEPERPGGAI